MFEKMDWQIHQACHSLRNDPDYAGKEINIVGISQGGLISRSIVEKCEGLKVHTLFTYGAPHQGVSAYKLCQNWYCWPLNWLAGYMVQYHIIETFGAPTDYFRTWWNLDRYYENSIFLPYINNELDEAVMPSYKDNISRLTNFGLFMWTDDEVVHPRKSEWFGVYNKHRQIVDVYDTKVYRDDTIGLKSLNNEGKLFFYSGPGIHMTLTDQYIDDYLIPLLTDGTPTPSEH
jgi:palmitoyl-protein thioesterase